MFHTNIENVTNFIPTISLEKKKLDSDLEKPRIRSSRTDSTIPKPLPLQSNPLPLATPFSLNLKLSDRDFNTLKSVAGSDFAERSLFERWTLSEIVPKDIKPSQLYRYFVYLLGHRRDHPSLILLATKLKKRCLDGSLDPKKVSVLATTIFANRAPLIPLGTKLTEGIGTPNLGGLDSPLIGQVFSFLSNNVIISLNTRMRRLSSIPFMATIMSRNLLARTNPAIVRWIESLKLPTTNWVAINRLVQQPDFLLPTRVYGYAWLDHDLCPLSDGRVAFMWYSQLQILNPSTGIAVAVSADVANKIPVPPGKGWLCFGMMEIPYRRLAMNFGVGTIGGAYGGLGNATGAMLIYDIESDRVLSSFESGEVISSFGVAGNNRLVLALKNCIQIRDSQTGQLQLTISDSHAQESYKVVGFSNGLFATVDGGSRICIWDSETGMLKQILIDKPVSRILNLQVTSDGNLSAVLSDVLHVWNPETGERIKSCNRPFSAMPHDLFALNLSFKELHIKRMTTGESIIALRPDNQNYISGAFKILPDGRIITTYYELGRASLQYDQIPNLIAAATSPLPQPARLPAILQSMPVPSSDLLERRVVANPVRRLKSQKGKIRRWVVLAVLVSAIAWAWLSYRPQTVF